MKCYRLKKKSKKEYKILFNKKMKEMLESGKLTSEMLSDSMNISEEVGRKLEEGRSK